MTTIMMRRKRIDTNTIPSLVLIAIGIVAYIGL